MRLWSMRVPCGRRLPSLSAENAVRRAGRFGEESVLVSIPIVKSILLPRGKPLQQARNDIARSQASKTELELITVTSAVAVGAVDLAERV